MKHIRKLAAWLLSAAMVLVLLPAASAAAETPNLSFSFDKEKMVAGDTLTVTVSSKAMKVSSVLGGFRFEAGKLTCTSISAVTLTKQAGGNATPTAVSTVTDANTNGTVAFAFAGTQDVSYAAGTLLTATFAIKEDVPGAFEFTLYESSDGTNAFSAATVKNAATKTIYYSLQPLGRSNLALAKNGGFAFANSEKNSAKAVNLNDGTNARWQPTETTEGAAVYAGIYWKQTVNIDELTFYWRDVKNYAPALTNETYVVKISTDTTNGKDGTWKPIACSVARRGPASYDGIVADNLADSNGDTTQKSCGIDTVTFDSTGVKGVRLEMKMPAGGQIQLFEMEAYGTAQFAAIKGDTNGDGEVTAEDLTTLARHVSMIAFIADGTLLKNADVDSNNEISADDLTKLARFVAGIDKTL